MTTREELEARKEALEAELARRDASKSTSQRQADLVTRSDREEPAEDRPRRITARDGDPHGSERYWEQGHRVEDGQVYEIEPDRGGAAERKRERPRSVAQTSLRQAAQVLRGPRRLPTRNWRSEE